MQKVLLQEGAAFADLVQKKFDGPNEDQDRYSATKVGPGSLLAMDALLARAIQEERDAVVQGETMYAAVFDREFLANELLV